MSTLPAPLPLPASPIVRFPEDWKDLSLDGKRHWLIDDGQARDWHAASSLLSKHGHAMRARRKARKAGRRFVSQAMQAAGNNTGSVTVRATCTACGRVVYEVTQHSDGRRERIVVLEHRQTKYALLCTPCETAPAATEIHQAEAQHERRAA